jgi:hypothetical protein
MAAASAIGLVAEGPDDARWWFSESPSRVVCVVAPDGAEAVEAAAAEVDVPVLRLGTAGGAVLQLGGLAALEVAALRDSWQDRLPAVLGSGTVSG